MSEEYNIIGKQCSVKFRGGWCRGKLIKNDMKHNRCVVETKLYGTIKIHSFDVRLANKED